MNKEELRIGNCVSDGFFEFKVTEIQKAIICAESLNSFTSYTINLKNVEPILITEKWLLKLGFKKTKDCYRLTNKTTISLNLKILYPHTLCGIGFEIKYIHQLQNLYFALIGKELILK